MVKQLINVRRKAGSGWFLHAINIILLVCTLLVIVGCTQSQLTASQSVSGDKMAEANHLYENGVYEQAAEIYQNLVDAGVDDGAVYYNLGNANFKLGDLGKAILNYRRAQRLLPRDPDVEVNLQLARAQIRDRLEREGNGLAGFVNKLLVGWSTIDEVAGVALGLWILICGCAVTMLLWHHQRSKLGWVMMVLVVGLFLCMLSVGIRLVDAQRSHGVVVSPSIEVRSGPGTDYLVEFSLHSGAEVRVLEYRSGWARIALPGNLQGWVPDEVVEEL